MKKLIQNLLNILAKFFPTIRKKVEQRKQQELYKKKLEELRKRDPFIYKNH